MRGRLHDGRVSKKDDQMALLAGRVRGQTVRGLVIGLIYPHSPPECRLHQLHQRHRSRSAPLFVEQKMVFMVFVPHRNSRPLNAFHLSHTLMRLRRQWTHFMSAVI